MKRIAALLLLFVCVTTNAFSYQNQDDEAFINHTVKKGQTVYQIARIYGASPHEILRINPDASEGIEVGQVLKIPKSGKSLLEIEKSKELESHIALIESKPVSSESTHMVKPKETVYGLAKQYGLTLQELVDANPHLAYGLKIGQVLTIPVPKSGKKAVDETKPVTPVKKEVVKQPVKAEKEVVETVVEPLPAVVERVYKEPEADGYIHHIVQPKETKWRISKKYGVTIEQIEEHNPESDVLSIGELVLIPTDKSTEKPKPQEKVKEEVKSQQNKPTSMTQQKAAQTKSEVKQAVKVSAPSYMKTDLDEDELELPSHSKLYDQIINKPVYGDLLDSINKEVKKELVLLLPFNLSKIESDTIGTLKSNISNNRFLNMTLDFYSGALKAIDSANALGLKINVRIIDSEESRSNSDIAQVLAAHDFTTVNAVIGPFKRFNIQKTTGILSKYDIPIISPLSKETSKLDAKNLFNSIPPENVMRKTLLDYVKSKNANVIAVIDKKQILTKNYLIQNYDEIHFAELDSLGKLNEVALGKMLVNAKQNTVIIESANPALIMKTVSYLKSQKNKGYLINIATTDRNKAFDNPEIALEDLVSLNLHYPSITREDSTRNNSAFAVKYKEENNVFPNQYAIRGFDLTYDTILRLAQNSSFLETTKRYETEYIENRFSYDQDPEGGYFNRGVYVLSYGEDFTIKKVK